MGKDIKSQWQQQAADAAHGRQVRESVRAGDYMRTTQHTMQRRCLVHDYSAPGYYHITLRTETADYQPLGQVVGDEHTAWVQLTEVGKMVEQELLHTLPTHYPMIEVQDYVIMPEHMHFILYVHTPLQCKDGKTQTLGRVIAGFKYGCTRQWMQMKQLPHPGQVAQDAHTTQRAETDGATASAVATAAASPSGTVGVLRFGRKASTPLSGGSEHSSLFAKGYTDVMPLRAGQLADQRTYIHDNPRMRWLRSHNRAFLSPIRGGVDTALTMAALRNYLMRECHPTQVTEDILVGIEALLLRAPGTPATQPTETAGTILTTSVPGALRSCRKDIIDCDTYGNRALLDRTQHRLLPLVCHRKDATLLEYQTRAVMEAAIDGAIIVSASINPHENAICKALVQQGYPIIKIEDNGFPEVYHPSAERQALCSMGKYLILTPWRYHYRGKDESIRVAYCKTMNCLAQALCRTKDSWWKDENKE